MGQMRLFGVLAVTFVLLAVAPAMASAQTTRHECQKPVRTGVEVYGLRDVRLATACSVALALFSWEASSSAHQRALYGCRRPKPEAAGYPYLHLHSFRGWRMALRGPEKQFTMSRGRASFEVTGTDFPLNCT